MNFWIELKETSQGHQVLSATIKGEHYTGFLTTKTSKRDDGSTFTATTALMKICVWDKCQLCHPQNFQNWKENF